MRRLSRRRGTSPTHTRTRLTDAYANTRRDHVFELVGYGLEESMPFFSAGGHTRQKAQIS
jgi:hypothetical protein